MLNVIEILARESEIDMVRAMTEEEQRCWVLLEVAKAEAEGRMLHGNGAQWHWVKGDWRYFADTSDRVLVERIMATKSDMYNMYVHPDEGIGLRRFVRSLAEEHNLYNVLEAIGTEAPVG